jgi:hypothetical protein
MSEMLLQRLYPGTTSEQYVPGGGPLAALRRLQRDLLFGRGARTTDQLCVEEKHMKTLERLELVKRLPINCSECGHNTGKLSNRWSTTSKGDRL